MKIVCDNCSTKYSIADEKVRGKIFKIKCKKCSHIIVVKGQEATGEGQPAGFDQKDTRVFDYSGFEGQKDGGGPAADPIWHLVIDREQVGPLTVAELGQKWTAGEVDLDTYAWREGFDDWKRLGAIEELAAIVRRDEAEPPSSRSDNLFGGTSTPSTQATGTGRADPTDLFAAAGTSSEEEAPAGDLFGGRASPSTQPSVFASSNAPGAAAAPEKDKPLRRAPKDDQPLFSLAAAEGGGNGYGTDPIPKSDARPMTAQRNENSVLFSLNNLAALATGAADPSPPKSSVGSSFNTSGPDGSGLIDIRAMAAMTMSGGKKDEGPRTRGHEDDLPVFSATSFSTPAVTVLSPQFRGSQSNKTLPILLAILAVLVVLLIGFLAYIFVGGRKPALVESTSSTVSSPPAASSLVPPSTTTPPASTTPPPTASPTPPASTTTPPASTTPPATGPTTTPPTPTPPGPQHATTPSAPPAALPVRDPKKKPETPPRVAAATPDKSGEPAKPVEPPPVKPADLPPKAPAAQKCDEVACLVTPDLPCCPRRNSSSTPSRTPAAASADSSLADKLDQSDIIAGMKNVNARVMGCNDKAKGAGQFKVKVTVGPDGNVSMAQAQPPLAGTPAASCVEGAVKAAKFKRTKQPITFNYPYTFR